MAYHAALMSPATKFTLFCFATVATLVVSYIGRRRGWFKEQWARPVHHFVLVYCWSLGYLLGTWHLPVRAESLWVPLLIGVMVVLPALAIGPMARRLGLPDAQVGVTIVAAGIANTGFTLGAYICYLLLTPGEAALGLGSTWGAINVFGLVLVIYPLVRRYGELDEPGLSNRQLIWRSLTTLPALPMYGALAGWTLAITGVQPPGWIERWYVLDVVVYVVCIGSYFGIGLRLWIGHTLQYVRGHVLVAVFAFVLLPVLMWVMIGLSRMTGRPIDPFDAQVLQIESFMPIGVSTVVVANVFHLDARMAGNVWLWNTLGFLVFVLPVIWWVN